MTDNPEYISRQGEVVEGVRLALNDLLQASRRLDRAISVASVIERPVLMKLQGGVQHVSKRFWDLIPDGDPLWEARS